MQKLESDANEQKAVVSAAPPEGMVEVPVTPTDEILDAMARVRTDSVAADLPIFGYAHLRRLYKAMIAARPPQQGDSAIATSERPDRASSDRGTLDREVSVLMIQRLEAQAAHIDDNVAALRKWADTEHEARCRELCAMYLREMALTLRMELDLDDTLRATAPGGGQDDSTARSANGNAVASEAESDNAHQGILGIPADSSGDSLNRRSMPRADKDVDR